MKVKVKVTGGDSGGMRGEFSCIKGGGGFWGRRVGNRRSVLEAAVDAGGQGGAAEEFELHPIGEAAIGGLGGVGEIIGVDREGDGGAPLVAEAEVHDGAWGEEAAAGGRAVGELGDGLTGVVHDHA